MNSLVRNSVEITIKCQTGKVKCGIINFSIISRGTTTMLIMEMQMVTASRAMKVKRSGSIDRILVATIITTITNIIMDNKIEITISKTNSIINNSNKINDEAMLCQIKTIDILRRSSGKIVKEM